MDHSAELSKRKLVNLWQKLLLEFDSDQLLVIRHDQPCDWLSGRWNGWRGAWSQPPIVGRFNRLCEELAVGDYPPHSHMLGKLLNDIAEAAHQVALFILSEDDDIDRVFEMQDGILIPIERLRPRIGPYLEEINQVSRQILTAEAKKPEPALGSTFEMVIQGFECDGRISNKELAQELDDQAFSDPWFQQQKTEFGISTWTELATDGRTQNRFDVRVSRARRTEIS